MKGLILISFIIFLAQGYAQKAEMVLDKTNLRIGEQTVLRIFFDYENPKEDALIGWPQFDDELSDKIEIIDKTVDYESMVDSISKTYRREQQLTVTAFEPGNFTIAPVEIELNETVYTTNSLQLIVSTVEVDTSKGIVDIKPKYEVEYTFGERAQDWLKQYWPWLVGAGVLIAIFFLIRLLKNKKGEEEIIEVPKIPAHITALEVLNELLYQEKWKAENKKDYYSTLTDTVRLYLEERFDIFAMEETTREILTDLKTADISDADKAYLKKILNQADMVKFAKFTPSDEDGFSSLHQSIEFVERTKKLDDEEENKKD